MAEENSQIEGEDEADEEEVAAVLAAEQEVNISEAAVQKLVEEGESFHKPSKLKFGFLFVVAGIVDIVDASDFTGVGIILSKIVSIGGTGVIYFTLWLTDNRIKRAHQLPEDVEEALVFYQRSIARATSLALRASKAMSKIPVLGKLARQVPRTLVKIRRIARKNPLTKILIGGAINLIPFLAILNLMIVWVYMAYRDEKKAFRHAREVSEEAMNSVATGRQEGLASNKIASAIFAKKSSKKTPISLAKTSTSSPIISKQPPQVLPEEPKNTAEVESEKLKRLREPRTPDWMRDKKVDEAMTARSKRMEVAERLGHDKDESIKMALEAERADDERRYGAA